MEDKFKLQDESGDRKYFSQLPNMIVNHSTAYEQSLYWQMKRLAGEKGSCYASLNTLSKKMGVHKTTVSKTIAKLLKREWIKEVEPKKVSGGIVRQFVMVDLWVQNIKEYESVEGGAEMTTHQQGGAEMTTGGAIIDGGGAQSDTKNIYKENLIIKNQEIPIQQQIPKERKKDEVGLLIDRFKKVNPSYERLFKIPSQRVATQRLLDKIGFDKLNELIDLLQQTNQMPYAPIIITPYMLEIKLGQLLAFISREKLKINDKKIAVL